MKLTIAKIVMRVIGTLAGVLGIFMLWFALMGLSYSFSKGGPSMLLWAIFPLLLGVYLLYVSYLVWLKFSPLAVQHICGTLAFWLIVLISKPYSNFSVKESPWLPFAFLGSFVVIYIAYRISSARLSRFPFPEPALEKP